MLQNHYIIRNATPAEFKIVGALMVDVYAHLEGFPKPAEQPKYYELLANVGDLVKNTRVELLVAVSPLNEIDGAVVFFSDMQYYGSGGIATQEKNAAGFRLLCVNNSARGKGLGRMLTEACIQKTKDQELPQLIIHTTMAMQTAWKMYEGLGFKRSSDLDFMQGALPVFGFRLLMR